MLAQGPSCRGCVFPEGQPFKIVTKALSKSAVAGNVLAFQEPRAHSSDPQTLESRDRRWVRSKTLPNSESQSQKPPESLGGSCQALPEREPGESWVSHLKAFRPPLSADPTPAKLSGTNHSRSQCSSSLSPECLCPYSAPGPLWAAG